LALFGAFENAAGESRVPETLSRMSWEEKIGQMILVYNSPHAFLSQYHIGGVLIMSNMLKDPHGLAARIGAAQKKSPIGLFVAIDQEGGQVSRLSALPEWRHTPSVAELRKLPADSILAQSRRIALALKRLGANMNLAPVLDPSHDWSGKQSFMENGGRSFGRSASEIVRPATAFIEGFRNEGVVCVSKHFPGYDVQENSDHHIAISDADSATLARQIEAFSQTLPHVAGVMMSSIRYRKISEGPSVFSPAIVAMARKMDPGRLLMTDDLWGAALRAYVSGKDSVHPVNYPDADFKKLMAQAFWAGNDIFMITFPGKVALMQEVLLNLARSDAKARGRIDASVARILRVKEEMGLVPVSVGG
jgi:beta-N-acetylhexosaminidase